MADMTIRRIKLKNGAVYSILPCDVMPYLAGKTQQVSKALLLRKYGVPYELIAQILGRNAMYWQRLEESLGRMSLVGSLCKKQIPEHLAADAEPIFVVEVQDHFYQWQRSLYCFNSRQRLCLRSRPIGK